MKGFLLLPWLVTAVDDESLLQTHKQYAGQLAFGLVGNGTEGLMVDDIDFFPGTFQDDDPSFVGDSMLEEDKGAISPGDGASLMGLKGMTGMGVCDPDKKSLRVMYGTVTFPRSDCANMGGSWSGNPDGWMACHLHFCTMEHSKWFPAETGTCPDTKAGYGIVRMGARDCRRMGGGMDGHPDDNEWILCHLDWCAPTSRARLYSINSVQEKSGKVGYGIIYTDNCKTVGGALNAGKSQRRSCHLNFNELPIIEVRKKHCGSVTIVRNVWMAYGDVTDTRSYSFEESFSTSKGLTETATSGYEESLSATIGMEASSTVGGEVYGGSATVSFSTSVTAEDKRSFSQAATKAYTETRAETKTFTKTLEKGFNWYWVSETKDGCSDVNLPHIESGMVVTHNKFSPPCCPPGEFKTNTESSRKDRHNSRCAIPGHCICSAEQCQNLHG